MNRGVFKRVAVLIILCLFTLQAQEGLEGRVTDTEGNPVEGADVVIVIADQSTKTNSNGEYQFATSVINKKAINFRMSAPSLSGNRLSFSVGEFGEKVSVELYNLSGKAVKRYIDHKMGTGNYIMSLDTRGLSRQTYLLKIKTGKTSEVIKMPVFNSRRGNAPERVKGDMIPKSLQKTGAVVDTLRASAPGYREESFELESYSGIYNFELEEVSLGLLSPADSAMITDSRQVQLSWNESANADHYEVWINVTKETYDWYQSGSLLDRYTKVAEVTETSYTTNDLSDRWTYKWYIVAVDGQGQKSYSDASVFGVYVPELEAMDDGVSLIDAGGYLVRDLNKDGSVQPFEDWHRRPGERAEDLLGRMTLEQKTLQLFYNGYDNPEAGWAFFWPLSGTQIRDDFVACSQAPFGIPYISAGDQIHGYKVTYPNQPGLAATRNMDIAYKCGDLQRRVHRAISAYGNLGPLSEIGTFVLYPRIQEGCGEDADLGAAMVRAMICGYHAGPELNPDSFLETLKHWPSQGAGGEGSVQYDWVTIKYHMKSWIAAVEAGVSNIMPGYAGCPILQTENRGAGDDPGIIGYLRDSLNYDGIITTDWLPSSAWVNACNAGSDVMGGANPDDGVSMLMNNCSESRITEACRRVLETKFRMGMFENPYPPHAEDAEAYWETLREEEIVEDATRQSLTLLKNNGILPVDPGSVSEICVTGDPAQDDDYYHAWYSWCNTDGGIYPAIVDRASNDGISVSFGASATADVAICFVGENTYTHGTDWPTDQVTLPDAQLNTIRQLKDAGVPVVVVFIMPRPYIIDWSHENADAIVVAYRPGDGAPTAVSEFLFGDIEPNGVLPWQLPRTMEQIQADEVDVPYDMGATSAEIEEIRQLIDNGEHVEPVYGDPLYQCGYGIKSW